MESILEQTNKDWELVIFDNYSTDGSWEYFNTFANHPQVRLYQAPKAGMYPNWNNCLRAATGQYVHIATSDDTEKPNFQETLLNLLETYEDCPLAYCRYERMDETGKIIPTHPDFMNSPTDTPCRRAAITELVHGLALWPPWFTINSVVFRRDILDSAGFFPADMGPHGDTAWSWRAALAGDFLYSPEPLAQWRRHASQATTQESNPTGFARDHEVNAEAAWKFFREEDARIPPQLKARPDWQRLILDYRYSYIREFGGLTRETLRRDFPTFKAAASWAWRFDRPWFMRQLLNGFGYPKDVFGRGLDKRDFMARAREAFRLPEQVPVGN